MATRQRPAIRKPVGAPTEEQQAQLRESLRKRESRATLKARALAAAQHAARRKRARLVHQWERRAARAVRYALSKRGMPYVYGGTGPRGYDCSGLMQSAWRSAGVRIPRVTHDQYRRIPTKVGRRGFRRGDLLLFYRLGHVGMYIGNGRFVHSPRPGRVVTVERLNGYYRAHLVGGVRPAWPKLPHIPRRR